MATTTRDLGNGITTVENDPEVLKDQAEIHQRFLDEQAKQVEVEDQRQQAVALYQALRAGTATNRQVQGVLAFLLRREMT